MKVVARIVLYLVVIIGVLGVAFYGHFAWEYLTDTDTESLVREENLTGMAIILLYFGAFWLAAPMVALVARKRLKGIEIALSCLPLLAAVVTWLAFQVLK